MEENEYKDNKKVQRVGRQSRNEPEKDLFKAILKTLGAAFLFWLLIMGWEGVAGDAIGALVSGDPRVTYWAAGGIALYALIGAGLGVVLALPWARKVSSWKRVATFLVMAALMLIPMALVFIGVLGALPATAIIAALFLLSQLRQLERFQWPW